jgi:hypothetical protein
MWHFGSIGIDPDYLETRKIDINDFKELSFHVKYFFQIGKFISGNLFDNLR